MKQPIIGFVISLLLVAYSPFSFADISKSNARMIEGKVVRVVDGDTIKFSPVSNKKTFSVRLVGIDTPESHFKTDSGWANQGHYADEASSLLEQMIPAGSSISVLDFDTDKYGRVLGTLFKNNEDINLKMVEAGYAIPYFICSGAACNESFFTNENVDIYFKACEKARKAGLGIYNPKEPLPEMPFEFRTRKSGEKFRRYVGNYYTKELFEPNNYPAVDLCKRIFFDRADVAESLNYALVNSKKQK